MRKSIFILSAIFILAAMSSCSQSNKFEQAAMEQLKATITEVARDPSSVKLANFETRYLDDSLCIIQFDFTAKNGFGNEITDREEYVYIGSEGKFYEAYHEIDDEDDSVVITEEQYNKTKSGKIYEALDYAGGLRYIAAMFVNEKGREAGNPEGGEFLIPVPTGTGKWELKAYKDEFGEEKGEKYLVLQGKGSFSNSATTGSEMSAILFIDKDGDFSFRLVEYSSSIVKSDDEYLFRVKDSEEEVFNMTLQNTYSAGQMYTFSSASTKQFKAALEKEGVMTIYVKELGAWGTPDTYLFKLDVTGFKKAVSFLY
ncbi:MAG: hypothetical protein MJY91_02875 [Bacteroidales bacterium]|nr:hypothetical protein [Bacteroidales bacterium]